MKEIEKTVIRLRENQYGLSSLIIAILLFLAGCYAFLVALNIIASPFSIKGEPWIIKAGGLYLLLCGLLLFTQSAVAQRTNRRKKRLNTPGKPQLQKYYLDYLWDPHGINDETADHWKEVLLGAILFSLIIIPLNWISFCGTQTSVVLRAVTLLFDFGMAILLCSLVYFILHGLKYGKSKILFKSFPFFIGEEVDISFLNKGFSKIDCCLRYIEERYERRTTGGDLERIVVCYELYNEQKLIQASPKDRTIDITFALPDNSCWVNNLVGRESIRYWEIELESEQKGVDFSTSFLLPVYHR